MKTLLPVHVLRRLIGGAAVTGLALGSTILLTACEPDPPPPSPPPEQAQRPAQQPDDPARPTDDRQVTRDDPAMRDDPTRQDDPMTRDDPMARDDRRVTQDGRQMGQDDRQMQRDRATADARRHTSTEDLVGNAVRSRTENEEIGTIEDVLVDRQGNPVGVVVSVGDFLDTEDKKVALEWDRISLEDPDAQPGARGAATDDPMAERDLTVIVDVTREELENAPEFDREAWEREQETQDNNY